MGLSRSKVLRIQATVGYYGLIRNCYMETDHPVSLRHCERLELQPQGRPRYSAARNPLILSIPPSQHPCLENTYHKG